MSEIQCTFVKVPIVEVVLFLEYLLRHDLVGTKMSLRSEGIPKASQQPNRR